MDFDDNGAIRTKDHYLLIIEQRYESGSNWLLRDGTWMDDGVWDDTEFWID